MQSTGEARASYLSPCGALGVKDELGGLFLLESSHVQMEGTILLNNYYCVCKSWYFTVVIIQLIAFGS